MLGTRRPWKLGAAAALAAAAFLGLGLPSAEAQAGSGPRAVLAAGTFALRGLPFFSPNAIPCLKGEYALSPGGATAPPAAETGIIPGERIPVWFTREPLIFGAEWKRSSLGGYAARSLSRPAGQALALVSERYVLVFEIPSDDAAFRSIALAIANRFAVFFANAPTDAELSFPAFVDLPR
jgi:hypothetical protein